jgi:hypothetical protein
MCMISNMFESCCVFTSLVFSLVLRNGNVGIMQTIA